MFEVGNQIMKKREEEEAEGEKSARDRQQQNQGNLKGDTETQGSKALDSGRMVTPIAVLG